MADNGGKVIAVSGLGKLVICVLFYLLNNVSVAQTKYVQGTLETKEDWAFLARFCFLSEKGSLRFKFVYPMSYGIQNILLYFDDDDQWPSVYQTDKNCLQKEAVLKPENNQVIELSTSYTWSGCHIQNLSSSAFYVCEGGRTFRSYRERWWFIAASNCAGAKGINLKYELWMTNGNEDELFFNQFSADEFYILQVDIAFLLVFAFILVMSAYTANVLRQRQLFHTTYKMYMVSLVFEVFHLLFMCIGYGDYANRGNQNTMNEMKLVGRICEGISVLSFLLMLILMAKGYTITRGRLSQSGSIKIAVFMTIYVVTYAALFIFEAVFFDPGKVLYLYESPAGYGLIALRLLSWVWFCYAIFFTLKHYPEKATFYYPFFIFYTLWFWAGPIVILIAMHAMPLWVREKVVNAVENCVAFIGQLVFLILTRPSAANSNFPYHVRTTQIGIMNTASTGGIPMSANPNLDSFTAHAYAPSQPPPYSEEDTTTPRNNFSDIFTTSQTRTSSKPNGAIDINRFPHEKPRSNGNMGESAEC